MAIVKMSLMDVAVDLPSYLKCMKFYERSRACSGPLRHIDYVFEFNTD